MLALGIDPGTAICGYGVVEMQGSVLKQHLNTASKISVTNSIQGQETSPQTLMLSF